MPEFERWARTWADLELRQPNRDVYDRLIHRYQEPHRAYHTLQHLDECFAAFDRARECATRPAELEVAIWFHDVIYYPQRQDNEEMSARLAYNTVWNVGATEDCAVRIHDLIIATCHTSEPSDSDTALLVDSDLWILAADRARFTEYEHQIRTEYAWVSEEEYRTGRSKVLEAFLDRPRIYSTAAFAEFEESARSNLQRAMDTMRSV